MGVLFTGLSACQSSESKDAKDLEGVLFFPLVHSSNFYGLPDDALMEYRDLVDSLGYDQLMEIDPNRTRWMLNLETHNLMHAPYVQLELGEGRIGVLFLDSAAYEPFKSLTYDDLTQSGHRVKVAVEAKSLGDDMFLAQEQPKITKESGEMHSWESEMQVPNYE